MSGLLRLPGTDDRRPVEVDGDGATARGRLGIGEIFSGRQLRDVWRPNYRARRVAGQVLLTSDHGSWTLVDDDEFALLRSITLPDHLHRRLEALGLIITRNNANDVQLRYERWTSAYFTGTSLHILGITRRCNLHCLYCHASVVADSSDVASFDMSPQVGRGIVDFAFESPSPDLHFEFQGGEATLNMPTVRAVHAYALAKNIGHQRRLTFSIVSNLVEVSDVDVDFLVGAGIRVTTTIELGGPDEPALRVTRAGDDRRDVVQATRQRFRDAGLLVPGLMVVTSSNVHRMHAYIDEAVASEQTSVFLSPVQKLGFAKGNWARLGLEPEEYLEAWRDAQEYMFFLWDEGVLILERQLSLALQKLFGDRDVRYVDFRNPNGMVLGNLAYDQHGHIYACDEARGHRSFSIGRVGDTDYASAVASARATELVSLSLRDDPECASCGLKPLCHVSPIVSKVATGDPYPKPLTDAYCRMTMGIFDYVVSLIAQRPERVRQAMYILEEQA